MSVLEGGWEGRWVWMGGGGWWLVGRSVCWLFGLSVAFILALSSHLFNTCTFYSREPFIHKLILFVSPKFLRVFHRVQAFFSRLGTAAFIGTLTHRWALRYWHYRRYGFTLLAK